MAPQRLTGGYVRHLRSLVPLDSMRRLKVVADAGNGMAGYMIPRVFEGLPLDLVPLLFELDGTFPNHEANPLDPANLRDCQRAVLEYSADIGLAFDGDADRCFIIDERGQAVSPSAIIGLIASRELAREPGAAVVHNVITSAAAVEVIRENGGRPVRSRVGHSFMKAHMAEQDARRARHGPAPRRSTRAGPVTSVMHDALGSPPHAEGVDAFCAANARVFTEVYEQMLAAAKSWCAAS